MSLTSIQDLTVPSNNFFQNFYRSVNQHQVRLDHRNNKTLPPYYIQSILHNKPYGTTPTSKNTKYEVRDDKLVPEYGAYVQNYNINDDSRMVVDTENIPNTSTTDSIKYRKDIVNPTEETRVMTDNKGGCKVSGGRRGRPRKNKQVSFNEDVEMGGLVDPKEFTKMNKKEVDNETVKEKNKVTKQYKNKLDKEVAKISKAYNKVSKRYMDRLKKNKTLQRKMENVKKEVKDRLYKDFVLKQLPLNPATRNKIETEYIQSKMMENAVSIDQSKIEEKINKQPDSYNENQLVGFSKRLNLLGNEKEILNNRSIILEMIMRAPQVLGDTELSRIPFNKRIEYLINLPMNEFVTILNRHLIRKVTVNEVKSIGFTTGELPPPIQKPEPSPLPLLPAPPKKKELMPPSGEETTDVPPSETTEIPTSSSVIPESTGEEIEEEKFKITEVKGKNIDNLIKSYSDEIKSKGKTFEELLNNVISNISKTGKEKEKAYIQNIIKYIYEYVKENESKLKEEVPNDDERNDLYFMIVLYPLLSKISNFNSPVYNFLWSKLNTKDYNDTKEWLTSIITSDYLNKFFQEILFLKYQFGLPEGNLYSQYYHVLTALKNFANLINDKGLINEYDEYLKIRTKQEEKKGIINLYRNSEKIIQEYKPVNDLSSATTGYKNLEKLFNYLIEIHYKKSELKDDVLFDAIKTQLLNASQGNQKGKNRDAFDYLIRYVLNEISEEKIKSLFENESEKKEFFINLLNDKLYDGEALINKFETTKNKKEQEQEKILEPKPEPEEMKTLSADIGVTSEIGQGIIGPKRGRPSSKTKAGAIPKAKPKAKAKAKPTENMQLKENPNAGSTGRPRGRPRKQPTVETKTQIKTQAKKQPSNNNNNSLNKKQPTGRPKGRPRKN